MTLQVENTLILKCHSQNFYAAYVLQVGDTVGSWYHFDENI